MGWECLKSETLLECEWVKVKKDCVRTANGVLIEDFYSVSFKDAAAVAAFTPEGEVILKKEFRYTYGRELIEVPAGMIEERDKDPLAAAKRELLEETGYVSDRWVYLGPSVESSSKLTNHMHLCMALDCKKADAQHLDPGEVVDVLLLPFREAIERILSGEICCCSSAHVLFWAGRRLGLLQVLCGRRPDDELQG